MLKNMNSADRIIRTVVSVIIFSLIISGVLTGLTAIITGILAAVLLFTGFAGFCPLYHLFGLSSLKPIKNK